MGEIYTFYQNGIQSSSALKNFELIVGNFSKNILFMYSPIRSCIYKFIIKIHS